MVERNEMDGQMNQHINRNIRDLRLITGQTQREFAESLDVDNSLISKVESGDLEPSAGLVKKISSTYRIKLEILYDTRDLSARIGRDAVETGGQE